MWARLSIDEVRSNALLTIVVDRLLRWALVVLKPDLKQRNHRASLFFRKEFETRKEQDQTWCRVNGQWHVHPEPSRQSASN